MQAAVLTTHGQPPEFREHPDPTRTGDTLGISPTAAPITPLDLLCASGASYFGPPALPYVPGVQGVGRAADGTRAWFSTSAGMAAGDGSMASQCCLSPADVVPLGSDLDGVSDTAVASLGLSAIAAWRCLTARAGLAAGERVLVLGSSGVVGQVAVQAARLLGATHVTAACRSTSGAQRALDQGADAVVTLDPADDASTLAGRFRETCPAGFDVVIDPLFGVPAAAAVLAMADHGRLVHLGSSAGPEVTLDSATVRSRSLTVLGFTNNAVPAAAKGESLLAVLRFAAAGSLSVTHQVRPLAEVAQAWADQAAGPADGRIVLTI